MKAWQYDSVGATPELRELADPHCPPDGVLVEVALTGLCRSDWHAWAGHDPVPLPMTPGHEWAGTVVEVGPDVRRVEVGQRVTAPFVLGCGVCEYCRQGDSQVCPDQEQPGFTRPGSFARLLAVPRADANVVPLPDAVGFAAGATLGCRFATAFRAVHTHGRLTAGQWLAVFGCGGVGLSAVQIAIALGARVVALDPSSAARERAAALGAVPAADAAEIVEITGGGAHVGLDAIGDPTAAAASVRALRRRGRHVQAGLLLGDQALTALPMDVVITRELSVHGSHGMPVADYPGLLELVASGRLDPTRLVGRTIALADAGPALVAMGAPGPPGITLIDVLG